MLVSISTLPFFLRKNRLIIGYSKHSRYSLQNRLSPILHAELLYSSFVDCNICLWHCALFNLINAQPVHGVNYYVLQHCISPLLIFLSQCRSHGLLYKVEQFSVRCLQSSQAQHSIFCRSSRSLFTLLALIDFDVEKSCGSLRDAESCEQVPPADRPGRRPSWRKSLQGRGQNMKLKPSLFPALGKTMSKL